MNATVRAVLVGALPLVLPGAIYAAAGDPGGLVLAAINLCYLLGLIGITRTARDPRPEIRARRRRLVQEAGVAFAVTGLVAILWFPVDPAPVVAIAVTFAALVAIRAVPLLTLDLVPSEHCPALGRGTSKR
jgi:hypothetical protein